MKIKKNVMTFRHTVRIRMSISASPLEVLSTHKTRVHINS